MKIVIATTFILVMFLGLRSDAFQVTSPKLVFGPDAGLGIDAIGYILGGPSGGQFDDYIISSCRKDSSKNVSTPLYKKKADGTYEMLFYPELQVCSYFSKCATTNGKWIFVAGSTYGLSSSFKAFYSFNESGLVLTTRIENEIDPKECHYAKFISEDTLMTIVWNYGIYYFEFVEWKYDGSGWNETAHSIDFSNIAPLTSTSFDPVTSEISSSDTDGLHLFSKQQETGEWSLSAMFNKDDFASYEDYMYNTVVSFNGNNTVIYLGGSDIMWSSGTMYIAEYQKSNQTWHVVQTFNSEDIGLDNEYLNIGYSWISSSVWINQDMAFLMAPNYPMNYNGTDWIYGGSVVMMYRNESNQWQMGGRISINGDDGTGEAVQLTYLTRTKNDIIITGNVINYFYPAKYFLYTYPLCFPNKMNFTCHQNILATSCNQADFVLPSDISSFVTYVDDKCGEPMMTVSHVEIVDKTATSNGTVVADLKFERLGLEVGQCTTTFFCPPPIPPPTPVSSPPQKVSGAVLIGPIFRCDITGLMALITMIISAML